jgi:hypothetical protein
VNQPKFGAAGKIKKADEEIAVMQISETLKSIETDLQKGRLDEDEKTHGFHKITAMDAAHLEVLRDVTKRAPELADLSTESLGMLLFHRLKAQGYTLYFDEKVIAETLEKARARLGGLLD